MSKIKKTLALVAALTLVSAAFAGCGDKKDSSSSSSSNSSSSSKSDSSSKDSSSSEEAKINLPSDGDTFTVMTWTDDDLKVMDADWEKANSGKKVTLKNFGVRGGEAADLYDQYFKGGEDVDLFMVEADWALKYINDDSLTAPLSDVGLTESDFSDAYSYTLDIGKSSDGVLKGVSWQAAPGGFCYRTDLAEKYLGVKTPEDMQKKVADWDTFQATAKEVYDASGDAKTALTTTVGGMWQVFSANRASAWVENDKLVVDDSCTEFMNLAKTMWDNGYVTKANQWTDEWWAQGQTDNTMGYFVSTWGFGDTILGKAAGLEGGATWGKWNVCQGPQEFFWGGTWMCVSKSCDNAEDAQSFIKYFTVDQTAMKSYALEKPEYVNSKTVMQAIVDEKSNSNANLGGQDQFAVLHKAAQNISLEGKITPYDATIKSDFLTAVTGYLTGETSSVEAALDAFKDKVAEDVPDITVE